MRRFVHRLAIRLSIATVLAVALVLFAAVPAQAAQDALDSGAWDLARLMAAPRPPSPHLPLVLGAIVLLAAMSSSSGSRRRDRW